MLRVNFPTNCANRFTKPESSEGRLAECRYSKTTTVRVLCLVLLASCMGYGCKPPETPNRPKEKRSISEQASSSKLEPNPLRLIDVTSDVGLHFVYNNGEDQNQSTILESLGGGIGVLDFDLDGWPDLFFPGGGTFGDQTVVGKPAELFRNRMGKKFSAVGTSAATGFVSPKYTHGAFVADYNNDGFADILVTGYGGLQLWQNQGDGTFDEVHEQAMLLDPSWSSGAGWGDFNNDGVLDIYVAHYVNWSFENHPYCQGPAHGQRDICPPRSFEGLPDTLYLGIGDGTFRDATEEWQLRNDGSKGLGVLIADFDANGFVDVYVANDTTNNYLYSNSGSAPFQEIASLAGVAADKAGIPNGSMGLDICDFNQNGRPDIWVTNYEREDFALYRNEASNAFLHVSDISGLNVLGGLFVGFGTVCSDLDLDGREDIVVNNGHVILYPTASPRKQKPVVMVSKGRRFERAVFPENSYFQQSHDGRGLVTIDIDNDGDMDLVFSNMNAPAAILRNDAIESTITNKAGEAPAQHWLQVALVGTDSNRTAIGAKVKIEANGMVLCRFKKGGGSYMSTSQDELSWGLGANAEIDSITIDWPSGKQTVLQHVKANQKLLVIEPRE